MLAFFWVQVLGSTHQRWQINPLQLPFAFLYRTYTESHPDKYCCVGYRVEMQDPEPKTTQEGRGRGGGEWSR